MEKHEEEPTPVYEQTELDRFRTAAHPPVTDAPSFFERTKKAFAGGIAGLATGGIGSSITAALADGAITGDEVWGIVTLCIGGFLLGFATVYVAPANES